MPVLSLLEKHNNFLRFHHMTPTTFGSDFKILIAYNPQENKWLHSGEIPQPELPLMERLY